MGSERQRRLRKPPAATRGQSRCIFSCSLRGLLRCTTRLGLPALAVLLQGLVVAQPTQPPTGIYSCLDDRGRRLTADRPIAECSARDQQVLNRDGSLKALHPPSMTADERSERDNRERIAQEARATQADAVRRDRNLVARYPTEVAHQRAREAALDTVRLAVRSSEMRLNELALERRPLQEEAEFYKGKPLPLKLRTAIDANDASSDAQRSAAANQESELGRINRLYDSELERLRRLWSGTPAGSLGPLQPPRTVVRPASLRPAASTPFR